MTPIGTPVAKKSIVIIGAGIAGLATGCYAQMNGYTTRIVEMAARPGGVCTSWKRQEYIFDGCMALLAGVRPGSPLNRVWQELGALVGRDVVMHDELARIEGRDGRTLIAYADADRLEEHLRELAPADAALSHRLCEVIRRCAALDLPRANTLGGTDTRAWLRTGAGLLPVLPTLVGWSRLRWQEFAARYRDRFLRDAMRALFDLPDMPLLAAVVPLVLLHAGDGGHPIGGSLAFAQAIEQRYRELGGQIDYAARVTKILVEGQRAVGVRLADGREYRANYVISAADGRTTIFELLEGRYLDQRIRRQYARGALAAPLVQVSLGLARDLAGEPRWLQFPLRTPVSITGEVRESLTVHHCGYDPTMAPTGKTAVAVWLETNHEWWAERGQDAERYGAEKQRSADAVVQALDERFPGLAQVVEVVDVATPLTWVRHTGNWRGAAEGWAHGRRMTLSVIRGARRTLPGLGNFFMVGQWVWPGGGLNTVAMAGRGLVQMLCKQDHRRFVARLASHPPARILPDFG